MIEEGDSIMLSTTLIRSSYSTANQRDGKDLGLGNILTPALSDSWVLFIFFCRLRIATFKKKIKSARN